MFPLHESTSLLLVMAAVAASAAAFTAFRERPALTLCAILLIVGAAWPWPVALFLGLDHYTIGAAIYAGAWTAGVLLAGLAWGALARRVAGVLPVVLVTLAPWLAGSAYLLERQRVPDASCAAEVEFHVGDLKLTVPRGFGLRSVAAEAAPAQEWEGSYGDGPGGKPHVRALCRVTKGGTEPIEVSHIWMSFGSFRRELEAACESGAAPSSRQPACAALARTEPTIVQFYATPEGISLPSLGQFNPDLIAQARRDGEREGYICGDSTRGPQLRYCTVWQQVTPEVFAVSSVRLGPFQEGEDPLADSVILLEDLQRELSPH
ncbi:MAG: hypothetical protein NXH83_00260 [Rhodobacteraceae bacterium]|nr:hypothetical protein [Paracoccaceae bacterium]